MTSKVEMEIAAVIPALNEAGAIAGVVDRVKAFALPIVVDDGSTDATAEIARKHGAIVISHGQNQGYEAALWTGFGKADELGIRYVITLDADGQHDPAIISRFHALLCDGYDLVIGVRSRTQRFGESVFSLVGRLLWGVHDPLCGMKAYTLECLQSFDRSLTFDSVGTKYAIDALRRGYRFAEIDIDIKPRLDQPRFGSGWKANRRLLLALYFVLKAGASRIR